MELMSRLGFALVATVAVVFGTGPAGAQEVTLSAVNFVPNHTSFGKPFAEWVEAINSEGKGLIQIEIKASGSMSPFKMGDAVKTGVVDMANLPATFYQNLLPIGDSLKLAQVVPAGPDKPDPSWALMNELHEQKVNAHYLASWGWGVPFHLYLRDKKIDKPDLTGLKLRITPVYRSFFRALGADLIQMKPTDVYTALERGTVDGYGWPIWDIKSFGWDKVTKYRVDPGFYTVTVGIAVNLDKWKSLSDAQRGFLQSKAWAFSWEEYQRAAKTNAFYEQQQKEAGIEVIELTGKARDDYLRTAYEAGWAEANELAPEDAAKLKALISK